jgi:hypothetical protein
MLSVSDKRRQLEKAHTMMMVGRIPRGYAKNEKYVPAFCTHLLSGVNVVIGGFEPKFDPSDDQPMKHEFLQFEDATASLAGTINDSQLSVQKHNAFMLLRNEGPLPLTLKDVLGFKSKNYSLHALSVGMSIFLREGDVLICKDTSGTFFNCSYRNQATNIVKFDEDWYVYVCLPTFAGNANLMAVFRKPGVLRDLRMRIEMFVEMWDESWDNAASCVVTSVNKQRKQQYKNMMFDALAKEAKKIRHHEYKGPVDDETDSFDEDEAGQSGAAATPTETPPDAGPSEAPPDAGPSNAKKARTDT